MKDAMGHGSDAGAHAQGTQSTPKLQRRHFEAIAAELKAAPDAGTPEHLARVKEVASRLATTNPGFRSDFFVAAATGGGYTNKSRNRNSDMGAAKMSKAKKYAGVL